MNIEDFNYSKDIIILGHNNPDVDSIVSGYLLYKLLNRNKIKAYFAILGPIENDELNMCLKYNFDPRKFIVEESSLTKEYEYILVDHNEHILPGKIIGIVDHHIHDEKKGKGIFIRKAASTSCIICEAYEKNFKKEELELACLAAFTDTASFHSTKSVKEDTEWVKNICKEYHFNYEKFYKNGLCLTNMDNIEVASLNGLKSYMVEEGEIQASYIQVLDPAAEHTNLSKAITYLNEYKEENGLLAFVFIVYNMTNFWTSYYLITDEGTKKYVYKKYLSRGLDIIPAIKEKLKK